MKNILFLALIMVSFGVKAQSQGKTDEQLQKECLELAYKSTDYKKVYADVTELKANIKLAKDNSLSRDTVMKQYNNLLGGYMGHKDTFDEVDARVNNDGYKLIQMVLLRTAAKIAREKAAESDKH
ncbi:hypothetical protein [Mucilaginibacter sp.]|uniref:hypothetical protein n=1 Tax=Mucilaginibacter sp. TaxID=1882438 RepID=UPI00261058A4|nr:hypothetical protein [Mucilaginibacter sp.]